MIGYLSGKLKTTIKDKIILDVNGVGYELLMPGRWLTKHSHDFDKTFSLYIHTAAKDNDITLIGFPDLDDKLMFGRLLKVPSVGPKTALLVLSAYLPGEIEQAVEAQNIEFFLGIKGLAKKTAQKIIIELRSQFKALQKEKDKETSLYLEDLTTALTSIGFSPQEIKKILPKIDRTIDLDKQIKQALKLFSA